MIARSLSERALYATLLATDSFQRKAAEQAIAGR